MISIYAHYFIQMGTKKCLCTLERKDKYKKLEIFIFSVAGEQLFLVMPNFISNFALRSSNFQLLCETKTFIYCTYFLSIFCRYHVWRGYWKANMMGSFCQLCYKLHSKNDVKYYTNFHGIIKWRNKVEKCIHVKKRMFENRDWEKVFVKNVTNEKTLK